MDDPTRKKIKRNLTFIKESICDELDTFVDGLIEKDVFDIDIKDRLSSARTSLEKSDILIYKILRKGSTASDEFIDLLRKKKYVHVLRKMDEDETEGVGASGESVVYNRDRTFIVKSFTEEEGARGAELWVKTPTPSLEPTKKPLYEGHNDNYKQLQMAYKGLREQLVEKRDQLCKMNQEKVAIEKELREVKTENQSLHAKNKNLTNEEAKLKAEIQELERHLGQKEYEISEIRHQNNKMEQMWNEERESRERLEKEVHDQSKMLTVISQVVQNIAVKFDCAQDQAKANGTQDQDKTNSTQDTVKTNTTGRRQPFMQGTKTSPNNSHNYHVNKTKGSAKKK